MPAPTGEPGDGAVIARQLDAVLLGVGFAATRELLDHVSRLRPDAAVDTAVAVFAAVRELVGDHVEHNAYFRDFPEGVPDSMAFWGRLRGRRAGRGRPLRVRPGRRAQPPRSPFDGPVTYLGIERSADLPAGSDVITLDRLAELVPG